MTTARIVLKDISCIRGGRMLFEGLSLALGPGEAALVRGPNGAGKSSLLRIAAGLLAPAAGRIVREGGVALAGEALALDATLPLAEALGFWARIDGGDARPAMAAMALDQLAPVPVRMLSTGQRRRADIARAIASPAAIWLLDEPANGLDAEAQRLLDTAIARHRGGGGIVVVTSHQPLAMPGAVEIALA